jgi:hypothetical protein
MHLALAALLFTEPAVDPANRDSCFEEEFLFSTPLRGEWSPAPPRRLTWSAGVSPRDTHRSEAASLRRSIRS